MIGEQIVEHHTHYKELHGYDSTVFMTKSEHVKLHNRLRRENKCHIPVDELRKISAKANHRTSKYKVKRAIYNKNVRPFIQFTDSLMSNVHLYERVKYNYNTGFVSYNSRFRANNGKKLYYCGDLE